MEDDATTIGEIKKAEMETPPKQKRGNREGWTSTGEGGVCTGRSPKTGSHTGPTIVGRHHAFIDGQPPAGLLDGQGPQPS